MRLVDGLDYRYTGSDQEINCSPEAIAGIAGVLDRLGASRAMVVCGPSILAHSDVVPRVQDALGSREAGLFTGIAPHSPVEVLYEAVAMARGLEPDVLVAVGGGSTSDTCKGIAMMLAEGGDHPRIQQLAGDHSGDKRRRRPLRHVLADAVGAHAEINRLAERQQTRITKQQVGTGREKPPDHDLGDNADPEIVCHQGNRDGRRQEEQSADQAKDLQRFKVL